MLPRPLRNCALKKYVPFTEVEWKYVQRKFMSDDMKDLQRVVALMSMWICRMQHDAPVIIGISEMLLHAHLNGKKLDIGTATMERSDLAQIYGSTITRFINYVNEVCQDMRQTLSIANAVSKMGIPVWVVNIRHEATHGQMPPLNLMREAILFCRRWLWRKHWSLPFNEAIKENLPRETVEKHKEEIKTMTGLHLITAMSRFREWRKRYRSLDHFHSSEGGPVEKVRIDIERMLDKNPDEFLLFFAKSCLAPSSSAIGHCSPTTTTSPTKHNNNISGIADNDHDDDAAEMPSKLFCIDEDVYDEDAATSSSIVADDGIHRDDGDDGIVAVDETGIPLLKCDVLSRQKTIDEITVSEQDYYRPVIILINNKGCLQRLLVELTRLVSQRELAFGELCRLAGWANLLLGAYLKTADSVSTQNWRLILKHIVLAPQFFNDEHIDKLLEVLGDAITNQCRQRLTHLLKIGRQQQQSMPLSQQQNGAVEQQVGMVGDATVSSSSSSAAGTSAQCMAMNNNINKGNILDLSMQSVKSLSDLQERIRTEDLADSTFVRDPLTLEDAWSIAQPEELGPLGLTADQRPDTLCLTLGEWGEEMRRNI